MAAKYTSNNAELKSEIQATLFKIADVLAKDGRATVVEEFFNFPNPPIDSGTLRRSVNDNLIVNERGIVKTEIRTDSKEAQKGRAYLTGKPQKNTIKDVFYAKFVEFGTVKMPARPFMRNGMAKANKRATKLIKAILK